MRTVAQTIASLIDHVDRVNEFPIWWKDSSEYKLFHVDMEYEPKDLEPFIHGLAGVLLERGLKVVKVFHGSIIPEGHSAPLYMIGVQAQ